MKEDIRLGDIVMSKLIADRPGLVQYDFSGDCAEDQFIDGRVLDQPSASLLTAVGKADIFDEGQIPLYVSKIVHLL